MSKEKYKKYIIEMLDKIESESALERIYTQVSYPLIDILSQIFHTMKP